MSEQWLVDGPRVIDVGAEGERVRSLVIALVGGQVDVVTHDDSPTARVEISKVDGLPVRVAWDGKALQVTQGKDAGESILDALRRIVDVMGRTSAVVSVSVPAEARVTVNSVTAAAVVTGLRKGVKANTVSGSVTLSDIEGAVTVNSVSGSTEGVQLRGDARLVTISGGVTVQSSDLPRAKVNTVSGEVVLDLTNGRAEIASNSVSGDVTIRAPFTGYAVTGNSASGQVVIDGQALGRPQSRGAGASGSLRHGDESLSIKANSVSGNITLLRPGQTPSAPPPPQDAPATAGSADPEPDGTAAGAAPASSPQDSIGWPTPSDHERARWHDEHGGQQS